MFVRLRNLTMVTATMFVAASVAAALVGAGPAAADSKPKMVAVNVHDSLKGTVSATFTVNVPIAGVPKSKTLELSQIQTRDVASWPEGILIRWEAIPLKPEWSPYLRCKGIYQVDSLKPTIKLTADNCEKHEVRTSNIVLENTSGKDDIVVRLEVNQLFSSTNIQLYANDPKIAAVAPDEEGKYHITIVAECATRLGGAAGRSFAAYDKPVNKIKFDKDCKLSAE